MERPSLSPHVLHYALSLISYFQGRIHPSCRDLLRVYPNLKCLIWRFSWESLIQGSKLSVTFWWASATCFYWITDRPSARAAAYGKAVRKSSSSAHGGAVRITAGPCAIKKLNKIFLTFLNMLHLIRFWNIKYNTHVKLIEWSLSWSFISCNALSCKHDCLTDNSGVPQEYERID